MRSCAFHPPCRCPEDSFDALQSVLIDNKQGVPWKQKKEVRGPATLAAHTAWQTHVARLLAAGRRCRAPVTAPLAIACLTHLAILPVTVQCAGIAGTFRYTWVCAWRPCPRTQNGTWCTQLLLPRMSTSASVRLPRQVAFGRWSGFCTHYYTNGLFKSADGNSVPCPRTYLNDLSDRNPVRALPCVCRPDRAPALCMPRSCPPSLCNIGLWVALLRLRQPFLSSLTPFYVRQALPACTKCHFQCPAVTHVRLLSPRRTS